MQHNSTFPEWFVSGMANSNEGNMPKLKTHKGAKKRFKITGTGRILKHSPYTGHLFTNKSAKRKRNLRKSSLVDKTDERRIKRLLPYS
jgi:large subunit ribosomal protein L35